MKKRATIIKCLAGVAMLLAATHYTKAADRTWTGGAGTTIINTGGNWTAGTAPTTGNGDRAIWDGAVTTNVPYFWNAGFGSGNAGGMGILIGGGYTTGITIHGIAGQNAGLSNIVIQAGAGPFTLGDTNGVNTSTTVWRSAGTNGFLNYSTNTATIAQNVFFNNGSGANRSIYFVGSWDVFSPVQPSGAGAMSVILDGTGENVLTLNSDITANSQGWTINNGTLKPMTGGALAIGGTQTLTIGGGAGIKRLALTNNITLNPAVANINIAGRTDTAGAANAAIYNLGGLNTINGVVRFNAAGGTNVVIYNASDTLTLNSNLTAANVTGDRFFHFAGPGTTYVSGVIGNGSANVGVRLENGTLVLNNANTHSGRTIVNGGTLTLGNNLALQNSSAAEVNGGVLDLNGGAGITPFVAGLSGAGGTVDSLNGGTTTLTVGSGNGTTTYSGSITNSSGTVSLNKIGTGTLTLTGANGYGGGTTVSNGTLLVNNTVGSGTGSGNVLVVSGTAFGGTGSVQGNVDWQSGSSGTFTVNAVGGSNSTPFTVSGNITLNGNAVKVNVPGAPLAPGTYRLVSYTGGSGSFATAPTYTGAGAELGTASSISTSGGAVTLTVIFTGVVSTWTNDVDGVWATGANWDSNPYYPQVGGDSAILGDSSAYRTVTFNANLAVGTISFINTNSFHIANAGNTLTLSNSAGALFNVAAGSSNAISPAIALNTTLTILSASGTALAITNSINDGGGAKTLTLSGPGTVQLDGSNSYGPAAGTVGTTLGGGVLQLGNSGALGAGDLAVVSNSTIRAGAPLTLANNIMAGSGLTTTLDNSGNNVTLSGAISGGSAVVKNGTGTLNLNASNSYTGNTTINAGTVRLGNANAIPGGTNYGNVTMGADTTLDLNGYSVTLNGLNASTNTAVVDSTTGGSITLTLGSSGAGGTFLGSISNTSGSLSLVKNGPGTQTLAGNNGYSGTTVVNDGTLQIGNGGETGNLAAGPVTLATTNANLAINRLGTNIIASNIGGSGNLLINNVSNHVWLTGNNTFTGNVTLNSGHLWITNPASLGVGPKTVFAQAGGVSVLTTIHLAGNVTIGPSIGYRLTYSNGVLINESGTNTVQGDIAMTFGGGACYIISSNGLLTLSGTVSAIDPGRTFQLGGDSDGVFSGAFSDTGGNPIGAITKVGSGTWTFTGDNGTYGANIAVNAGKLLINSLNLGAGSVTVASNATFGGTGTIYKTATWQAGAKGRFTASYPGYAAYLPLNVYNTVTLSNNQVEVFVDGATPLPPGSYTLLNASTVTGAFASTPIISGAGVQAGTIFYVQTTSSSAVLVVAASSTWINPAGGNWTVGANWDTNPNFPDSAGEYATLGYGSSFVTVNLDTSESVGGLNFTNQNSFAVTNSANTLTMNNNGMGTSVSVTAGTSNVIATKVTLYDATTVSAASGTSLAIAGDIDGFYNLTKTGNGTLTLSGSNTFLGFPTLSGGTLALGSTNAIGAQSFTINGGNLDSVVPNLVNANDNAMTWAGNFGFIGSQSLNLGLGSVLLTGNRTVTVNSNTLTIPGTISGSYTLTLRGTNNGTLQLDGTNYYTGLQLISGTLALGNDSAIGALTTIQIDPDDATGPGIRSTDSTKRTITNNVSPNSSVGPLRIEGTGEVEFTGLIPTGRGYKMFYINNPVTTISGAFTFSPLWPELNGATVKQGPGTLVLSGITPSNMVNKPWRIEGGTLALGTTNSLGTGVITIVGGGLDSIVPNLVMEGHNPQNWSGDFYFIGSQNLNIGTNVFTLSTNVTVTVSNNTMTVDGAVSGPTYALTKQGTGRLVLNGTNSYGNTTVNAGTLEVALATLSTNSTVTITNLGVLQLNFSTTNQVGALVLNGVSQADGVYSSANTSGRITGTGSLRVVTPVAGPTLDPVVPGSLVGSSFPVSLSLTGSAFTASSTVLLTNVALVSSTTTFVNSSNLLVSFTPGTVASAWTATVLDSGNYSASRSFNVTQPAPVTIDTTKAATGGSGKVVLEGTGGVPGNSYAVVSTTNLVPPVVWTPVVTNTFDGSGNFSYTNTVDNTKAKLFLRIQQ